MDNQEDRSTGVRGPNFTITVAATFTCEFADDVTPVLKEAQRFIEQCGEAGLDVRVDIDAV